MRCTLEMRQCIAVAQTPPPSPAAAHIEALVGSKKSPTTRQSPARPGPARTHYIRLNSLCLCLLHAGCGRRSVMSVSTRRDATRRRLGTATRRHAPAIFACCQRHRRTTNSAFSVARRSCTQLAQRTYVLVFHYYVTFSCDWSKLLDGCSYVRNEN